MLTRRDIVIALLAVCVTVCFKSTARTQKCRDCTSDISRNQLAIAGDAEEGAAVE